MIIQPIEPQVDCPITTAIFLPETQRFLKFHQTKQNLEIHGGIQLCSYVQLKKNVLNADKKNKIAQNSNKHVELKIAQNSNTRQRNGRGTTFVPASASPPTRFVFSRVPFGVGNRNYPQSAANDDSETRADPNGDLSGDGLTAVVGLSLGGTNGTNVHTELTQRGYEMGMQSSMSGSNAGDASTGGIPMQMLETPEHTIGIEWDNVNSTSISLDMKTPLSHFPPFRFGVRFEDVHRLGEGQVKHSTEVFYAGSLWKVSVQAFNDEDPQGRRTLGLFLHRRKAEITDMHRKVHMYVDSREKVTARYQLTVPSKREMMVFGSFKQTGTLLPKFPKGWGWRTALLFDELADLLQNGALRVIAVVQLV